MATTQDNQLPAILSVKKGLFSPIRIRFDTVLRDHKMQWYDVYKKAGLSKAYASLIRNGHMIPPNSLRIKIASVIGCDTSVLWESPELISADQYRYSAEKMKIEQGASETSSSESTIKREEVK